MASRFRKLSSPLEMMSAKFFYLKNDLHPQNDKRKHGEGELFRDARESWKKIITKGYIKKRR